MAGDTKSTVSVSLFHRILHRSYRLGTGISFFVTSRVTPAAWVLGSVVVVGVVLGMDIQRSTLYHLVVFGGALMGVGILWAWSRRARLQGKRTLPPYATVGEECRYSVEVENMGLGSVRGFWLWERHTDPRTDLVTFALTKEPRERRACTKLK